MADPAQAEAPVAASASPISIKQEPTATFPDLPDLSLALESLGSKRPLDTTETKDDGDNNQASKRIKTEAELREAEPGPKPEPEPEPEPESDNPFEGMNLEDDMALLVSNALSNANDLMQQYSEEPNTHEPSAEPMDIDNPSLPESPRTLPDFDLEPHQFLRVGSIRALGNLAVSILLILSRTPFDHALSSVQDEETEQKRAFEEARTAFQALKQFYGRSDVLSAAEAGLEDSESQNIMHLANLAQLGLWLADCSPATLSTANSSFLRLLPANSGLTDDVVDLFLAIKTQLAVHSISTDASAEAHENILKATLQDGLEEALRARHEGEDLSVTEQHLLTSVEVCKAGFSTDVQTPEGIAALKDKYPLTQLSKSLGIHFRNQLSSFADLALKLGLAVPADEDLPEMLGLPEDNVVAGLDMDEDLSSFFEKTTSGLVQDALAAFKGEAASETAPEPTPANGSNGTSEAPVTAEAPARATARSDYEELEALVAQSTSDYVKNTLNSMSPMSYVPQSTADGIASQTSYLSHLQQNLAQHQYFPFSQPQPEAPPPPSGSGENLPPNQSCPSAMLYDKARQAALSKTTAHTRREGLHSTRRPWTQEEEKALMAGLDMVKGPHWSQILTLFGPHGTISDILKDRTQVQLKDKARNLKLFFLKTNSEMPYYLQAVTGELKTRAPTQAARKEAEERARMNSEEDQAKLQGIMALAGGLQHHPQHQQPHQARPASRPLGTVGAGVITPAQAAQQAASSNAQHLAGTQNTWRPNGPNTPIANAGQRQGLQTTTQQSAQGASQGQPRPQGQQPVTSLPRPNPPSQTQQVQHTHAHPQSQARPQNTQQPQATQIQAVNGQQGQNQHQPIRPAQSTIPAQQNQPPRPAQPPPQQNQAQRPQQQQYHMPAQQQGQPQAQVRPQAQASPLTMARPATQGTSQAQGQVQAQAQGQVQAQSQPRPVVASPSAQQVNGPAAATQPTGSGAQPAKQASQLVMPKPATASVPGQATHQQALPQQPRLQQTSTTPRPQSAGSTPSQHTAAVPATQNQLAMPRPQQATAPVAQPQQSQPQPQQPRPAVQQQAQSQVQPQSQAQLTAGTVLHAKQQVQIQPRAQAQSPQQAPGSSLSSASGTPNETSREAREPAPVDDDSAEAALLKDLQAAVAGVTS